MVRELTDDEVAFCDENGWVFVPELISPDLAAELLEAAKDLKRRSEEGWGAATAIESGSNEDDDPDAEPKPSEGRDFEGWVAISQGGPPRADREFSCHRLRVDPFLSLMVCAEMGRAAGRASNRKRLTDEAIGVRQCTDALMYLPPHEPDASLGFHQDQTFGTDRVGGLTVWIALDDVVPEQAALRFLTGSHREGPLGKPYMTLLDRYPKLEELHPLSPPRHFRPGDGTIHHGYTIHGRGPNQTGRPRWSFLSSYIPTDNVKLDNDEQSCVDFGLEVPSR